MVTLAINVAAFLFLLWVGRTFVWPLFRKILAVMWVLLRALGQLVMWYLELPEPSFFKVLRVGMLGGMALVLLSLLFW
jgi:hypothetical protein